MIKYKPCTLPDKVFKNGRLIGATEEICRLADVQRGYKKLRKGLLVLRKRRISECIALHGAGYANPHKYVDADDIDKLLEDTND